ncbi:Pentatricopeptide repeat [Dillenia turbinata]|uniref:Pentatricopeptide repeat n=1 Tax=Dillenia turbinata TaxID=194707 RepID=A0AAN8YY24_9MAGN
MKTSSTSETSLIWRNKVRQTQLISQISTILLQRYNWGTVLSHNLSFSLLKLTPPLFLQILHKTQQNPNLSLSFFNWAQKNLGFVPDLKCHSKIIQILINSNISEPAKPLFENLVHTHQSSLVVDSLLEACRGKDSQSLIGGFILKWFSEKGFVLEGLEVLRKFGVFGYMPCISGINSLLCELEEKGETRLAWCVLGVILRHGVLLNQSSWSIIAKLHWKDGKREKIEEMINFCLCDSVMYNLVIESHSQKGDFEAAFKHLDEMCNKKLNPGFDTYSLILDGACKFGNSNVIQNVLCFMVEKKLLSKFPLDNYDFVIRKLCELRRTFAAEILFEKAIDERISLADVTYGCMLMALSKKGRVKEATKIYQGTVERGINVNKDCYSAFVNALCKEDPSEEVSKLLKDIVQRGLSACPSEMSLYIARQCQMRKWREAESLLDVVLEKGFLPNFFCCRLLVEHYCSSRQISSAVALHEKLEKLEGTLDAVTYNAILKGLIAERKIEEAVKVFDFMKRQNLVSSYSFRVIIKGLCQEKELRKAMKLHDEMLKMGLKPDTATYKRLIAGFS